MSVFCYYYNSRGYSDLSAKDFLLNVNILILYFHFLINVFIAIKYEQKLGIDQINKSETKRISLI
jgi:hypothetical protein